MIAKRCAAFIVFVLAPLVSACDDRPAAKSSPSGRAAPPPPAPVEDLPGTTPGGTRLRFGEKAVITVGPAGDLSRVGVIITDVEQGTPQDQAALRPQLGSDRTGPSDGLYFIRGTIINEDGMEGVGSYSGPNLYGVTKDGEDAGAVRIMGPSAAIYLPNCTMTSTPPGEWATRGARHEICRIALSSRAVTGVRLANAGGGGSVYWH